MLSIRPGSVGPLVVLEDLLRDRWADARKSVTDEIARREATDVPLDGLKDPGEYQPLGYDGIRVRLRTLRVEDVLAFTVKFKPLPIVQTEADVAQEADSTAAARVFLSKAVAELHGLEDETGQVVLRAEHRLADADLDLIEGAGMAFFFNLLHAARVWQHLPAEARKNCGGSPGLISDSSCAASVKSQHAENAGATATPSHPGIVGPNTSQTPVPAA